MPAVTHRGVDCNVATSVPRATFEELEAACKRRGVSKSAYVRQLIEEAMKRECE